LNPLSEIGTCIGPVFQRVNSVGITIDSYRLFTAQLA